MKASTLNSTCAEFDLRHNQFWHDRFPPLSTEGYSGRLGRND